MPLQNSEQRHDIIQLTFSEATGALFLFSLNWSTVVLQCFSTK